MWADVDSSLIIIYLASFSIQVPQNRGKQSCSIRPFVQLPTTTPGTYTLLSASSSLTTIHNNSSSSSNPALGFIQTHGIPISFLSASSGLENRNAGSGGGGFDYESSQLQKFTFGGTYIGFYLLFHWGGLFRAYGPSTIPLRSQPMSYTNNNGHGPGYHQLAALQ